VAVNENNGLLSGLGNVFGIGTTPKRKASGTMIRSTITGQYEPSYATRTDASGKTFDVTESDYNDIIAKSTADGADAGTFKINDTTTGSSGLGVSDFATGAKTFGDIAGGVAGLGTIYLAKKNYDLQKEQDEYLKSRDAAADAKISKLQANYDMTA